MQNIRLAYDITPLGLYFSWPDSKTGIYRVAEEILNKVIKTEEISTTLMSICSEAPAFTSIGCQEYFNLKKIEEAQNKSSTNFFFKSTYGSHLHLEWLYQAVYKKYFSKKFQRKNKKSLESFLVRGPLKLMELSRMALIDTYKVFDPSQFDILHSAYYALPSKELTGNLARLITIYDLIPLTAKEFCNPKLNKYFANIISSIDSTSDWVACISEYTKKEFCDYTGFPEERAYVTYLAADSIFKPIENRSTVDQIKKAYNIPNSPYFLCLASHLDPRKNILHLITSFIDLIRENPRLEINLVLIGTLRFKRKDVSTALKEFAEYMDRIIFTGYVVDEDLNAIYNGSVAFVFPSLYEGFGLPILEAMQSGTPVISSNTTSLPEVTGKAAILVDPKDKNALCKAMLDVLNDESLRHQLIEKGLKRAKKFSWEKCAQETIGIYQEISESHE